MKKEEPEVKAKPVTETRFPIMEEKMLKYKDNEASLTEFLITVINKGIGPFGDEKSVDKKIEDATFLAKKRILEWGMTEEKFNTFTEQDVSEYMAKEIIPYTTDSYGILSASNEEECKEHLEYYLQKYPAGEEKTRTTVLKAVLGSEIPRNSYAKKTAKKPRRDKFDDINQLIKEINDKVTNGEFVRRKECKRCIHESEG